MRGKLALLSLGSLAFLLLLSVLGCGGDDDDDNGTDSGTGPGTTTVTVTDIDGNVYQTVTIGTQVWMMENLKVTHYRNGNPIPRVTDGGTWLSLTTDAYCEYDNNPALVATYGRLYNWYAVDDSSHRYSQRL